MVYLIKNDGTSETFENVIEWDGTFVMYKAGKGTCIVRAINGEYFTDVAPNAE